MKFFIIAAGSSAATASSITCPNRGESENLITSSPPNISNNSSPSTAHNSMQITSKGLGVKLSKLELRTRKIRPSNLMVVPLRNLKEFIPTLDPDMDLSWAITPSQKQILNEKIANGLDYKTDDAVKSIRQEAILRELMMNNSRARKPIPGSKLRQPENTAFDTAIEFHSTAFRERLILEDRIHSLGSGNSNADLINSYFRALKKELKAGRNLEMERLISYPKSGFNWQAE